MTRLPASIYKKILALHKGITVASNVSNTMREAIGVLEAKIEDHHLSLFKMRESLESILREIKEEDPE